MKLESVNAALALLLLAAGCGGPGSPLLSMPDAAQSADSGADTVVTPAVDAGTDGSSDIGVDAAVNLARGQTGLGVDPTILMT